MGKITILLKQHTPMWHFQANEADCTLRATEVKPKLDRFIVEQLGGKSVIPNDYWIDASRKGDPTYFALDYKLKFQAKGSNNQIGKNSYPTFFGNMGNKDKNKEPIYYPDGIVMTIFSLNTELQKVIIQHINAFFAFHNFGTRQSKGFGSFYIDDKDKLYHPIDKIPSNKRCIILSSFSININAERPNCHLLFKYIDTFYKSIRSGINTCKRICFKKSQCDFQREMNAVNLCDKKGKHDCYFYQNGSIFYCKSLLFKYLNSKNKQWDKKTIKQIISKKITPQKITESDLYLYRDLLGLATDVQYGQKNLKKEDNDDFIQRLKSPIFIKPIISDNKYIVYIGYIQLEDRENILNKEFTIKISQGKVKNDIPQEDICFHISTPPDFSMKSYFEYLLKKNEQGKYEFEIEDITGNQKMLYFKKDRENDIIRVLSPKCDDTYFEYRNLKHIYKELRENFKEANL